MSPDTIARWQFGITTVFHFLFVPLTIALSVLTAVLQSIWAKTGNDAYLRLTKFFGRLFLINFAMGVVTGIVQEFQFGMNWSEYSRFVGDIFGAPLALEALIAFFMESTFVGLWIFGWNKLSKKVHLAMIYLTAVGTTISAIFILAANSWMQNPVGATFVRLSDGTYRAELTDFLALIKNPFFLVTFPHVVGAAIMTAAGLVLGVAGWWLAKGRHAQTRALASDDETAVDVPSKQPAEDRSAWYSATRFGAWIMLVASLFVMVVGHLQNQVEAKYQPLKMAAAEGLNTSESNADLAIIATFNADGTKETWALSLPSLLSFLTDYNTGTKVTGLDKLVDANGNLLGNAYQFACSTGTNAGADQQQCFLTPADNYVAGDFAGTAPTNSLVAALTDPATTTLKWQGVTDGTNAYTMPNMWVTFYSFRIMVGFGALGFIFALAALIKTRKGNDPKPTKGWNFMMRVMPFIPMFACSFGWILTEMGRQPWVVYGVLPTSSAYSPTVTAGEILTSMVLYTLIYAVVAVIVAVLFMKVIRTGLTDPEPEPAASSADADQAILQFAY